MLKNTHIPCHKHLSTSEVLNMIQNRTTLSDFEADFCRTMREVKYSLKNIVVLRNLTKIKPILPNKTRWTGLCDALTQFIKMREHFITSLDYDKVNFIMNATNFFARKHRSIKSIC